MRNIRPNPLTITTRRSITRTLPTFGFCHQSEGGFRLADELILRRAARNDVLNAVLINAFQGLF